MKNIHTRWLLVILALAVLALYVVIKEPIRKGLDIQGGMRVVLRAETEKYKGGQWTDSNLRAVVHIIRNRVDNLGVAEPVVYPKPPDQIVVELPGLKNRQAALQTIQSTAQLEVYPLPELDNNIWSQEPLLGPHGQKTGYEQLIDNSTGKPVSPQELQTMVFSHTPMLTGNDLLPQTQAEIEPQGPVVAFQWNSKGGRIFEEFTRANIGKYLAIFLDKQLLTAPKVHSAIIGGKGIIEGNFTVEQARLLAAQLNAGALPVPLQNLQTVNVEATLGAEAVRQTTQAGILGLVLVLLAMLFYYRLPGLLADLALGLYGIFTFALFKAIPVTLTVPGIAGFILSIGMAVDANILIFERMKEELRSGKTLLTSIDLGFKRAFTAIRDSNICTLITCLILYEYGTGEVRGFAVTLAIGVLVSLFTAVLVTRTFLYLLVNWPWAQNEKLYGLGIQWQPRLEVVRNKFKWFALSGLVIVPGLIFWLGLHGIKRSIEFTGGTELQITFQQPHTARQIDSALNALGYKNHRVLIAANNLAFVDTPLLSNSQQTVLLNGLQQKVGPIVQTIDPTTHQAKLDVGSSNVSGMISKELVHDAILSVIAASVLIILFLGIQFRIGGFVEGLKFGTSAVIALLHDVLVVWGCFAIFGYFFNWMVDSLFVTALLTVVGFSVHDTIVIFDRIRENLKRREKGETFSQVADRSIEQTFARSINTSATVLMTLLALIILGGPIIRLFVVALFIGIVSGTYSSIFNATPILVWWKELTGEATIAGVTVSAAASARAVSKQQARTSKPLVSSPMVATKKVATTLPTASSPPGTENGNTAAGNEGRDDFAAKRDAATRTRTKKRTRRR